MLHGDVATVDTEDTKDDMHHSAKLQIRPCCVVVTLAPGTRVKGGIHRLRIWNLGQRLGRVGRVVGGGVVRNRSRDWGECRVVYKEIIKKRLKYFPKIILMHLMIKLICDVKQVTFHWFF